METRTERAAAGHEEALARGYAEVRAATERLLAPLSEADCQVQSMPDASPVKWNAAHTTWFFETFALVPHLAGYRVFHPHFGFLFNSYYDSVGERTARDRRGLVTRPGLAEVKRYRAHVDAHVARLLEAGDLAPELLHTLEVGLHHEQQHQELLLTDLKHALAQNPLQPAYLTKGAAGERTLAPAPLEYVPFEGGLVEIGHDGTGFAYDNEGPRHRVFLEPFALAARTVTNAEYLAFVEDGGYREPRWWLSDGWAERERQGWSAPLYWRRDDDGTWTSFTLSGQRPLAAGEPVTHLSFYEAEAYALWAGARLPTEAEWEHAAAGLAVQGNFLERGRLHPAAAPVEPGAPAAMFGDVWEWTRSAYAPYPGYRPWDGALGEYNGKFMVNQLVLRGGSCVSPASHLRASYRNFFHPHARWQFSGLRLGALTRAPPESRSVLRSFFKILVMPPLSLFALAGLGWLIRKRRPDLARWMIGSAVVLLYVLSMPLVSAALARSLQRIEVLNLERLPAGPRAIVVLAADFNALAPEYGGATVGMMTLERLRYGAALQRASGLPVLVAGGPSREGVRPMAFHMQETLEQDFGVPVRWAEARSTTTRENLRYAAELMELRSSDEFRHIYLVTHAWHVPRARFAAESMGFIVTPAGTGFRPWPRKRIASALPSAGALRESSWAVHEWIGRLWYALTR